MFDIGWSEMAVIALVALIVIGPKDLPRVARTVGQWVRKGRSLAREFQRSLEDMAREAELDEVKKEVEQFARTDLGKSIEKAVDPGGEISKALDPTSRTGQSKATPPTAPATPTQPAANGASSDGAAPQPDQAVQPRTEAAPANGGKVADQAPVSADPT